MDDVNWLLQGLKLLNQIKLIGTCSRTASEIR